MARPAVADKIAALEQKVTVQNERIEFIVSEFNKAFDEIAKLIKAKHEASLPLKELVKPKGDVESVGTVGREFPPEPTPVDDFLFKVLPDLVQKLAQMDNATAVHVTDWLIDEQKIKDFLILWFAVSEDLRKYMLFVIVLRDLPVNQLRFDLLKSTLSPEAVQEIHEAYMRIVEEAKEKSTPAASEE